MCCARTDPPPDRSGRGMEAIVGAQPFQRSLQHESGHGGWRAGVCDRAHTPLDTVEVVQAYSAYAADHVTLARTVSLDLGGLADFSRGGRSRGILFRRALARVAGSAFSRFGRARCVFPAIRSAGRTIPRFWKSEQPKRLEYRWIDRNNDGWFEPGEQGPLLMRFGGQYSSISPSLRGPTPTNSMWART